MYITKFGEVLKLFTIDDFSYGNHKLLTNVYDNSDITENIFNSTLYNYKKANVLDLVDNTTVCTTKTLDYIHVALNTVKASRTNTDKKLFFKLSEFFEKEENIITIINGTNLEITNFLKKTFFFQNPLIDALAMTNFFYICALFLNLYCNNNNLKINYYGRKNYIKPAGNRHGSQIRRP